jgi:hypothetical protein
VQRRADLSEQAEGTPETINELVGASIEKGQIKKERLSGIGITQVMIA